MSDEIKKQREQIAANTPLPEEELKEAVGGISSGRIVRT